MPAKAFLDTNVLIYAVADGEPRSVRAEELTVEQFLKLAAKFAD